MKDETFKRLIVIVGDLLVIIIITILFTMFTSYIKLSIPQPVNDCKQLCLSHDWQYMKVVYGYAQVCYCLEENNTIWTFPL